MSGISREAHYSEFTVCVSLTCLQYCVLLRQARSQQPFCQTNEYLCADAYILVVNVSFVFLFPCHTDTKTAVFCSYDLCMCLQSSMWVKSWKKELLYDQSETMHSPVVHYKIVHITTSTTGWLESGHYLWQGVVQIWGRAKIIECKELRRGGGKNSALKFQGGERILSVHDFQICTTPLLQIITAPSVWFFFQLQVSWSNQINHGPRWHECLSDHIIVCVQVLYCVGHLFVKVSWQLNVFDIILSISSPISLAARDDFSQKTLPVSLALSQARDHPHILKEYYSLIIGF